MIPRYARPDMAAVWSDAARFRIWFDIEAAALEAMAELGTVPREAARKVREVGGRTEFDIARIHEIERETRHDLIAFTTYLAELVGQEARHVHFGLTSSDVKDTCLAVQLTRSADILLADLEGLLAILQEKAEAHRTTPMIGRSHGIHAEPTTFGLKVASHFAAFDRARTRLKAARKTIATCAISGAVGTFAGLDPRVEAHVAKQLGLKPEPISTQVIPRDRHAQFFATLGVVASSIENLATEIRHLQRTEVGEVREAFEAGQKGSSAMPHKRNPVLSENLTGLARMVRGMVVPAMENVALWHERDMSHSSVERMIGPDACTLLDFAISRLAGVVEGLVVDEARMRANLERTGGLIHSGAVLLALTKAGIAREVAYTIVQRHAAAVWEEGGTLVERLRADPEAMRALEVGELEACFDLAPHFAHVDTIFERVFSRDQAPPA